MGGPTKCCLGESESDDGANSRTCKPSVQSSSLVLLLLLTLRTRRELKTYILLAERLVRLLFPLFLRLVLRHPCGPSLYAWVDASSDCESALRKVRCRDDNFFRARHAGTVPKRD